jgi:hypothetical protein
MTYFKVSSSDARSLVTVGAAPIAELALLSKRRTEVRAAVTSASEERTSMPKTEVS